MAMQKRFPVAFDAVFPRGAFLVGEVEAVADFNAAAREDGSRPQQLDKDSRLPVWSVQVLDADPEAGKRDKTVTVKLLAQHQPVPPSNETPFPFTPVEFVGLSALPWIDDNGAGRARIAWSFRAEGFAAPGQGASGKSESVKAGA